MMGKTFCHRLTQTYTDITSHEYTEAQSNIELRGNMICLKALLLGGRENREQWGVHDRNTSKLVFLSMPFHKAFKPSYISFRLWTSVCF
jgi:hypothetical protein